MFGVVCDVVLVVLPRVALHVGLGVVCGDMLAP